MRAARDRGNSPRKNAAITLGGSGGQRFGAAPGLNHGILRKVGAEDLIPADHVLAVFLQHFEDALIEIGLQREGVFEAVRFAEHLHFLGLRPRFAVDLIAADMEEGIGKERGHLADEGVKESVGPLTGGVEHGIEDAEVAADFERAGAGSELRIGGQPTQSVAGDVELGHHADAAGGGVGDHFTHLVLRVEETVGTQLLQLG